MASHFVFKMLILVAVPVNLARSATPSCASDQNFNQEHRFTKLETAVASLQAENLKLRQSSEVVKAELAATRNVFHNCISSMANKTWELRRTNYVFPQLAKVQLHTKTLTYTEALPVELVPSGTKALIISVFCNFWNTGGHAYLDLGIHQKGNEAAGIANAQNTHYSVYANNFYYEIMVPWSGKHSNQVVFKVSNTYNTGSNAGKNLNWYQVKMVGYIKE